jgi:hypothetical protein
MTIHLVNTTAQAVIARAEDNYLAIAPGTMGDLTVSSRSYTVTLLHPADSSTEFSFFRGRTFHLRIASEYPLFDIRDGETLRITEENLRITRSVIYYRLFLLRETEVCQPSRLYVTNAEAMEKRFRGYWAFHRFIDAPIFEIYLNWFLDLSILGLLFPWIVEVAILLLWGWKPALIAPLVFYALLLVSGIIDDAIGKRVNRFFDKQILRDRGQHELPDHDRKVFRHLLTEEGVRFYYETAEGRVFTAEVPPPPSP